MTVVASGYFFSLIVFPACVLLQETSFSFEGYWAGIDPNDGGDSRRTIVDNGNHFTMVGRDTVLSLCGGTEAGVLVGTGDLAGNGRLVMSGSLDCTIEGGSVSLAYTFTKLDDNLIVELLTNVRTGDLIYEAYFWRLASPAGSC